jgi:mycothiol system anti-sigma-R factor
MTCEEALRRLFDVIDKEASQYDVNEVQEHLEQCESCMARYEFEAMFKTFVKDKASSDEKADRLKSRILDRI